jgi:hypothetical protein
LSTPFYKINRKFLQYKNTPILLEVFLYVL